LVRVVLHANQVRRQHWRNQGEPCNRETGLAPVKRAFPERTTALGLATGLYGSNSRPPNALWRHRAARMATEKAASKTDWCRAYSAEQRGCRQQTAGTRSSAYPSSEKSAILR
jgi:hypothetical protein